MYDIIDSKNAYGNPRLQRPSFTLKMSYLVQLHIEAAAARVVVALAGDALVGRGRRGAAPRTVKVEA